MAADTIKLPPNPFKTIEQLANQEIIIAALRVWPEHIRWEQSERLIASALNDAQLVGQQTGRVRN
jgi:hypothetical protein